MTSEHDDFMAQILQADGGINDQSLSATNTKIWVKKDNSLLLVMLGHPANRLACTAFVVLSLLVGRKCGVDVGFTRPRATWFQSHCYATYVTQTNAPPLPTRSCRGPPGLPGVPLLSQALIAIVFNIDSSVIKIGILSSTPHTDTHVVHTQIVTQINIFIKLSPFHKFRSVHFFYKLFP